MEISTFAISQSFNLSKYSHELLEKGALNSTTTSPSPGISWVLTIRLVNKKSPLTSDRSHIHHALERLGLKGLRVSFVILVISSMLALTGVTLELIGASELVSMLLLIFVSLVFLRFRFNLENS